MRRSLLIAVAVLVGFTVVTAIAELWVRANAQRIPHPLRPFEIRLPPELVQIDSALGYGFVPNASKFFHSPFGEWKVNYQINEIGLRDSGMVGGGAVKRPIVLVLGDSHVESWGVMPEAGFLLETQRQIRFAPDASLYPRLLNAGMTGYGAAQSVMLGQRLMEQFDIRAIVFTYTGLMPVADHRFKHDPRLTKLPIRSAANRDWLGNLQLVRITRDFLAARRERAALIPGDPKNDLFAAARESNDKTLEMHAHSLEHVATLAQSARERNIPFMLLHLPLPHQVANDEWGAGRAGFGLDKKVYAPPELGLVRSLCERLTIRCSFATDMLRKLASERSSRVYFQYEYALTEVGHRALVNLVIDEIRDILGVKPSN